jgi:hypothetical protein
MKNNFPKIITMLSLLVVSWACDNGFADIDVIDTPPKITLGSISSGLTEGEDFRISVTLDDGTDDGAISSLASLDYTVTSGGATVTSGSEALSGDQQTVTISVPGGFDAGTYNFDVVVSDTNGNTATDNVTFEVASAQPDFDITGTWVVEPVAASLAVGPSPGSTEWFAIDGAGVTARACFYDDTYTFGADGSFVIDLGDQTWLETWQGVDSDRCGTPVAPYDGGTYQYTYTGTSLTVIGEGAYLGLSKVNNAGEVSQGAAIPDQITYTIVDPVVDGNTRRMTLRIEAGSGVWWDFKLISGEIDNGGGESASIFGNWKMEPIAGAFGVGPSAGSTEFFANSADDVTTRACFFDDVYTFAEDGTYSYDLGDQTWLETWQGVAQDGCGAPVAPHDGSGDYTFTFDGSSLKLIGEGAHLALSKVINGAELSTAGVAVPADVTYQVVSLTETDGVKRMTLHIEIQDGIWWTFKLISE